MKTLYPLLGGIRSSGIRGPLGEIKRRLNPASIWHGTFSKNRKVIKMTGVGNDPNETVFYGSAYHFLRNIPSLFTPKDYDYLLAQSYLFDEFLSCRKPKLFFTREPIPSMQPETREHIQSEHLRPYIYSYDEPDIEKRMFYVVFYESKNKFIRKVERSLMARRDKLCCIINRYSEKKTTNLVRRRIEFVRAMGEDIDLYGRDAVGEPNKWDEFPNYCGVAKDKLQTLREYNFILAFENTDYPGYITEKIIHAFMAGTIPLYWGGGGYLEETIPSNAYIDCRDQSPMGIYQMIKTMNQEEILSYRRAALDFLKSDASDRFTRKYWAEEVLRRFDSLNSSKNPNIPAKGNHRIDGHDK